MKLEPTVPCHLEAPAPYWFPDAWMARGERLQNRVEVKRSHRTCFSFIRHYQLSILYQNWIVCFRHRAQQGCPCPQEALSSVTRRLSGAAPRPGPVLFVRASARALWLRDRGHAGLHSPAGCTGCLLGAEYGPQVTKCGAEDAKKYKRASERE